MKDLFNEVNALFDKPIIKDPISGNFICPVCGKNAKKESTITKHLEQKDCISLLDLCRDTVYEQKAFNFCKENEYNMTINVFRKSVVYNSALRFIMFACSIETDPDNLLCYIKSTKKIDLFLKALGQIDYVKAHEFRKWMYQHANIMIN